MALNNDRSNGGVLTLVALAGVSAVAGTTLTVVGIRGREERFFDGSQHLVNLPQLLTGVGLLAFALQIWVLLLVFWAWRWERRTMPLVDAADGPAMTTAVRRSPRPAQRTE